MKFIKDIYPFVIIIILLPYMLFLALYKPSLKKVLHKKGLNYPPEELPYDDVKILCNKGYKASFISLLVKNKNLTLKEAKSHLEDFLLHGQNRSLLLPHPSFSLDLDPDKTLQALIQGNEKTKAIAYLRNTTHCSLSEAKTYLYHHAPQLLNDTMLFPQA